VTRPRFPRLLHHFGVRAPFFFGAYLKLARIDAGGEFIDFVAPSQARGRNHFGDSAQSHFDRIADAIGLFELRGKVT
jgi:hypothetical protein